MLKLYEANASCGGGCENEAMKAINVLFDTRVLEALCLQECDIVIIIGDSMEHFICDKSLCFINPKETTMKDSKIYAINTLDGLFVKQCYITGDYIKLVSFNDTYTPILYPLRDIQIMGRVRGVIKSL